MRIAIDLQGLQSPGSRNRGIGRYVQSLLEALLRVPTSNEYRLIANGSLQAPVLERPADLPIVSVPTIGEGGGSYNELLMKTSLLCAKVDAVFLPSPFEMMDTALPDMGDLPSLLYAVCYDIVPFLFADRYLPDPNVRALYTRRLQNVRRADYLFAISESTRQDMILHLGVPGDRVFNIGAGVSSFFRPEPKESWEGWRSLFASKLAITRAFVLYTGGEDWRKNIDGLITAFARLPADIRRDHQLVVACKISPEGGVRLRRLASSAGLAQDSVILTGFVTDEELRALYSLCDLFVFPSVYEGFGLPIVEALACGAPAITGNNSSLKEIITAPELLFDAASPASLAERIEALLRDDALRSRLRAEAPASAAVFTWEAVAEKVHAVLELSPERPGESFALARYRNEPSASQATARETLAFFSPLQPRQSGISDYNEEILPALSRFYESDLYIDDGFTPLAKSTPGHRVFRCNAFDSIVNTRRRDYKAIVYQIGNSQFHTYMYATLRRYAGITVLHDYALCGMINHASHDRPSLGITLRGELAHAYGAARADEIVDDVSKGRCSVSDLAERGIYGNRRIFTRSPGVIVHSQWACDMAVREHSDVCRHIAIVPPEIPSRPVVDDPDEIRRLRGKYGVPPDSFVFASCGIVTESKRPFEILDAFKSHLVSHPDAFLVFAGPVSVKTDFAAAIARHGLAERVLVTGSLEDMKAFHEIVRLSDVCISLRYPFSGETTASLLRMLAEGRATIVTDIGSFAEYPDTVVHRIPSPDKCDEIAVIVEAMRLLSDEPEYRRRLGTEAAEFVRRENAPDRCARLYYEFIERVAADPLTRRQQLADYAGRELATVGGDHDPAQLLAPFASIFASYA